MEKKKVLIIVGFVASIFLIGLSIFMIINKLNEVSKDSNGEVLNKNTKIKEDLKTDCPKQEESNCNCENNSTSDFYKNMEKNRQMIQDVSNNIIIVMDESGNVYWGVNEYRGDTTEKTIGTRGEYEIKGYSGTSPDGGLTTTLYGYKLDVSNVVSIHHVSWGNGGYMSYILIKNDGTIARLSYMAYEKDNKIKINDIKFEETVDGYNNIIGVINRNGFSGSGYYLYDIYGNIIRVS